MMAIVRAMVKSDGGNFPDCATVYKLGDTSGKHQRVKFF